MVAAERGLDYNWSPDRLIVNEVESTEKQKACYDSRECQEELPMLLKASESIGIILK